MTHNPTLEPARFQVRTTDNWQFWVYDSEYESRAPQGPFDSHNEASEHAKELNSIRWR